MPAPFFLYQSWRYYVRKSYKKTTLLFYRFHMDDARTQGSPVMIIFK